MKKKDCTNDVLNETIEDLYNKIDNLEKINQEQLNKITELRNIIKEKDHELLCETVKLYEAEENMYKARTLILKDIDKREAREILLDTFVLIGGEVYNEDKMCYNKEKEE